MAQFDFIVDTDPMAHKINAVNAEVIGVGAAVTAMEAAVIKTQEETCRNICNNLSSGFYTLMNSQISQKLALHYSTVSSKLMLMSQIAKSIESMKTQMHHDFLMIKKRYTKLFNSLDKELEIRIHEIDEKAMKMAEIRKNVITGKYLSDTSKALICEMETQSTKQIQIGARLKSKTKRALSCISNNIFNTLIYTRKVDNVLEEKNPQDKEELYIPVITSEEESLAIKENSIKEIYFPETLQENTRKTLETAVSSNPIPDSPALENEKKEIKNQYASLVSQSTLDDRTKQVMMSLFAEAEK